MAGDRIYRHSANGLRESRIASAAEALRGTADQRGPRMHHRAAHDRPCRRWCATVRDESATPCRASNMAANCGAVLSEWRADSARMTSPADGHRLRRGTSPHGARRVRPFMIRQTVDLDAPTILARWVCVSGFRSAASPDSRNSCCQSAVTWTT